MSGLADLLAGRRPPDVYRWAPVFGVRAVADAADRGGWAFAHLDGAGLGSRREVLVALGASLGFPGWYGANLDALVDCLRDLSAPTLLLWTGWSALAETDLAPVVGVLRDHAHASADLAVLLQGPGPVLTPTVPTLT